MTTTIDTTGEAVVEQAKQILGAVEKERRAKPKPRPYVLIDTREQRPLRFAPDLGVDCGGATLPAGDYSVRGFTALIALERKSVADLVGTLTKGRERFENELDKLAEFRWKAILVEGRRGDVEAGIYRSLATPQSIIGSLRAIWMRWQVPTFWLDSPEGCAREVAWYARRLEEKYADLKHVEKESA
ncbi:MAG TPA: ERCC4 domain-containing protein [Polyangiaceae bacterium]|nr:ERCC4 domain-containing protein [Polyangiaceae bacterium]